MNDSTSDAFTSPPSFTPFRTLQRTRTTPHTLLKDILNETATSLREGLPRDAILHALANGMLLVLVVVAVLVFWIMESFIRPLAWAVRRRHVAVRWFFASHTFVQVSVGFLLFPVKQHIAKAIVMWLAETKKRDRILFVASLEVTIWIVVVTSDHNSVSLIKLPGYISGLIFWWIIVHMYMLVLLGIIVGLIVFVEPIWKQVVQVLHFVPDIVAQLIRALDIWSSFAVESVFHMMFAIAVLV
jgi:hypothetical protein